MSLRSPVNNDPLPDTLSALLRLAVSDARSLDRDLYVPNAMDWHKPSGRGTCSICAAGAILAGTLGIGRHQLYDPARAMPIKASAVIANKLDAVEYVRHGRIPKALAVMGVPEDEINSKLLRLITRHGIFGFSLRHPHFSGWALFDEYLEDIEAFCDALESVGL